MMKKFRFNEQLRRDIILYRKKFDDGPRTRINRAAIDMSGSDWYSIRTYLYKDGPEFVWYGDNNTKFVPFHGILIPVVFFEKE